jgi:hypothetical protein
MSPQIVGVINHPFFRAAEHLFVPCGPIRSSADD